MKRTRHTFAFLILVSLTFGQNSKETYLRCNSDSDFVDAHFAVVRLLPEETALDYIAAIRWIAFTEQRKGKDNFSHDEEFCGKSIPSIIARGRAAFKERNDKFIDELEENKRFIEWEIREHGHLTEFEKTPEERLRETQKMIDEIRSEDFITAMHREEYRHIKTESSNK